VRFPSGYEHHISGARRDLGALKGVHLGSREHDVQLEGVVHVHSLVSDNAVDDLNGVGLQPWKRFPGGC
jgi:hypothetical protein